jgi:hypothetical protein
VAKQLLASQGLGSIEFINLVKNHSFSQAMMYEILTNMHLIARKTIGTNFCLSIVAKYHSFVPSDFTDTL